MPGQAGIYSQEELRDARELVHALVRTVRGHRLYGGEHPTFVGMIRQLMSRWDSATVGGPLTLRFTDQQALLDEEPIYTVSGQRDVIPTVLFDHGVVGFVFSPGVGHEEVRRLAAALAPEVGTVAYDFGSLLWEADLVHLQVMLDADDLPVDADMSIDEFAQQVAKLADDEDPPVQPHYEMEREELRDHPLLPEEPQDDRERFSLSEREQLRVQQLVQSDNRISTLRHAIRVVHGLARGNLTLPEAETLERAINELVAATARAADFEGSIEILRRVESMRAQERDLEIQVAELTLAVFLDPENLRTLLRGIDVREHLDPLLLGELLALLGPSAAPEAAHWLMERNHPKVVAQALRVFGDEAAEALVPLYADASDETRERIGPAFLEIGTPEAFQALAADFARLSERSRHQLVQVVARAKDHKVRDVVVTALKDRSERVRRAAVGALRATDAGRVASIVSELLETEAFSRRSPSEVSDFFDMLARIGNGDVAAVLASHCVPRGLLPTLRKLTTLQRLCLRAMRRMRSPDAQAIVEEFRQRGPKVVRQYLDDPLADL
ncbi:MAG: hypothetical protein ACYTGV_00795 [Planctomycetota bacterium]